MSEQRDVIEVLTTDHREVEEMFVQLESLRASAAGNPAVQQQRKEIVGKVIKELVRHSEAEEMYVYPAAKEALGDEQIVEHEIDEHAAAERVMNQLDGMSPDDPEFETSLDALMRGIRQHISEEEASLLPQLRQSVPTEKLIELGQKVQAAQQVAPTHPHASAPDQPPLNKVMRLGAAVIDKARDAVTGRGKD